MAFKEYLSGKGCDKYEFSYDLINEDDQLALSIMS